MMKSVFWWRKPEYPEETTDLRQVTDETFHTYGLCPVGGLNLGRSGVKQSELRRDESDALAHHPDALIFIQLHSYPSSYIHINSDALIFIQMHWYSSSYIHIHPVTLIFIQLHWYSSRCIDIHPDALIFIQLHWYSSRCIDIHPDALISIQMHWYSSSYIDIHPVTLIFIQMHWFSSRCIGIHPDALVFIQMTLFLQICSQKEITVFVQWIMFLVKGNKFLSFSRYPRFLLAYPSAIAPTRVNQPSDWLRCSNQIFKTRRDTHLLLRLARVKQLSLRVKNVLMKKIRTRGSNYSASSKESCVNLPIPTVLWTPEQTSGTTYYSAISCNMIDYVSVKHTYSTQTGTGVKRNARFPTTNALVTSKCN